MRRNVAERSWLLMVLLGSIVAAPAPTQATSITYEFSGTVNDVDDYDAAWPECIQAGVRFEGRLTLDLSAPDLDPDPDLGTYDIAAFASLWISIESVILRNDPSELFQLHAWNDWRGPEDKWSVTVRNPIASGVLRPLSYRDYYISIILLDDDADQFDGDALPLDLNLSAFETTRLYITNHVSGMCAGWSCYIYGFRIDGTIDAFEVVPEPSTFLLVGLGLAAIGIMRGWRGYG